MLSRAAWALLAAQAAPPPASAQIFRWTSPSAPPPPPWDQPCVDLNGKCEDSAAAGYCQSNADLMRENCCHACAKVDDASEDELLGCPESSAMTIQSLVGQVEKSCNRDPGASALADLFVHTECSTAGNTACRDALELLSAHAQTSDGKSCNAYVFHHYALTAVFWGACAVSKEAGEVKVHSSRDLSRALQQADAEKIVLNADIDYRSSYRDEDQDPFGNPAILVEWGKPVRLSGPWSKEQRDWTALTARFYVRYGTLALKQLQLREPEDMAEEEGALIAQLGGAITIANCELVTPSVYVYGHTLYSDGFGEILLRRSKVQIPEAAAKARGLASCKGRPSLASSKCEMAIDELRISDGIFMATGNSEDASCPAGAEQDDATGTCVYRGAAVQTECPGGTEAKRDASGRVVPGVCLANVECPRGSRLHPDGDRCVTDTAYPEGGSSTECPAGSQREGDACVYQGHCASGSSLQRVDGQELCVMDKPPEPRCPAGSSAGQNEDGSASCTWDRSEVGCPAGSVAAPDGGCVRRDGVQVDCPDGSEWTGSACVVRVTQCPDGAEKDEQGVCVGTAQFRASADPSNELFPCAMLAQMNDWMQRWLLRNSFALIGGGFTVEFGAVYLLYSLDARAVAFWVFLFGLTCQGMGIIGQMGMARIHTAWCDIWHDRICVAIVSILCWKLLAVLRENCRKICPRTAGRPHRSTSHMAGKYLDAWTRVDDTRGDLPPPYRPELPVRGFLTVTAIKCHDLIAADKNGKSDPYVKLSLSDRDGGAIAAQEVKTDVRKKTLHPKFDHERFEFHINTHTTDVLPDLDLVVMDQDNFEFCDDFLGEIKIDLHAFFEERGDWTYALGPCSVVFDLDDPLNKVDPEHWRERRSELDARDDDSARLGTVTVTMEFVPQRETGSPGRGAGYGSPRHHTARSRSPVRDSLLYTHGGGGGGGGGSYRHSPGRASRGYTSPGRARYARGGGSPRRDLLQGRSEAEAAAAATARRTHRSARRSLSPSLGGATRLATSPRRGAETQEDRAWRADAAKALNGTWEAIGQVRTHTAPQLSFVQNCAEGAFARAGGVGGTR